MFPFFDFDIYDLFPEGFNIHYYASEIPAVKFWQHLAYPTILMNKETIECGVGPGD